MPPSPSPALMAHQPIACEYGGGPALLCCATPHRAPHPLAPSSRSGGRRCHRMLASTAEAGQSVCARSPTTIQQAQHNPPLSPRRAHTIAAITPLARAVSRSSIGGQNAAAAPIADLIAQRGAQSRVHAVAAACSPPRAPADEIDRVARSLRWPTSPPPLCNRRTALRLWT